jgi:hypothetical protein
MYSTKFAGWGVESFRRSLLQVLPSLSFCDRRPATLWAGNCASGHSKQGAAACALRLYLRGPVANRAIPIERAGSPKKLTGQTTSRDFPLQTHKKQQWFLLCVPDRQFWHVAQKTDSLANTSLKKGGDKKRKNARGKYCQVATVKRRLGNYVAGRRST